ncbi:hypothetical protein T439DRAFT_381482 [Meredithblackwellia eburnea MCA 4105]
MSSEYEPAPRPSIISRPYPQDHRFTELLANFSIQLQPEDTLFFNNPHTLPFLRDKLQNSFRVKLDPTLPSRVVKVKIQIIHPNGTLDDPDEWIVPVNELKNGNSDKAGRRVGIEIATPRNTLQSSKWLAPPKIKILYSFSTDIDSLDRFVVNLATGGFRINFGEESELGSGSSEGQNQVQHCIHVRSINVSAWESRVYHSGVGLVPLEVGGEFHVDVKSGKTSHSHQDLGPEMVVFEPLRVENILVHTDVGGVQFRQKQGQKVQAHVVQATSTYGEISGHLGVSRFSNHASIVGVTTRYGSINLGLGLALATKRHQHSPTGRQWEWNKIEPRQQDINTEELDRGSFDVTVRSSSGTVEVRYDSDESLTTPLRSQIESEKNSVTVVHSLAFQGGYETSKGTTVLLDPVNVTTRATSSLLKAVSAHSNYSKTPKTPEKAQIVPCAKTWTQCKGAVEGFEPKSGSKYGEILFDDQQERRSHGRSHSSVFGKGRVTLRFLVRALEV